MEQHLLNAEGGTKKALYIFFIYYIYQLLNGFFQPRLFNLPVLIAIDIAGSLILPLFLLVFLFKIKAIDSSDFGLRVSLKDSFDELVFGVLFVAFPIILYISFFYTNKLSQYFFVHNSFFQGPKWHRVVPPSLGLTFYLSLTGGIFEEIFYRGMMRGIVYSICHLRFFYIIASSILFSSVHWEGGVQNLFSCFVFGLLTSSFFSYYRNLWPLIAGHFVVDFIILW